LKRRHHPALGNGRVALVNGQLALVNGWPALVNGRSALVNGRLICANPTIALRLLPMEKSHNGVAFLQAEPLRNGSLVFQKTASQRESTSARRLVGCNGRPRNILTRHKNSGKSCI